jgi:hypothetical protein
MPWGVMQPLDVFVLFRRQHKRLEDGVSGDATIQELTDGGKALLGPRSLCGWIGPKPIKHLLRGLLIQDRRSRAIRVGTDHRTLQGIVGTNDYPLPMLRLLTNEWGKVRNQFAELFAEDIGQLLCY